MIRHYTIKKRGIINLKIKFVMIFCNTVKAILGNANMNF